MANNFYCNSGRELEVNVSTEHKYTDVLYRFPN